jgi:di/tricarboxylate transporter
MSTDAIILIVLLGLALVGFITSVLRYDVVALLTLLAATALGIVPADDAFAGFGHPAVVTVAAVLVISRAFFQSGLVDLLSGAVIRIGRRPMLQVLTLTATVALLSAFMNNVGALALMLPVALKLARTHNLAPSCLLMPLSFGSLLGGLTTMIGTPPNVIVANYWGTVSGRPFGLFDFTPVGLGIAAAGVLFIGLIGWRILPVRKGQSSPEDRFEIESYLGELRVEEESPVLHMTLRQFHAEVRGVPPILAVLRGDDYHPAHRFRGILKTGDVVLVEGETEEIEALATKAGLSIDFRAKEKAAKVVAESEAPEDENPVPAEKNAKPPLKPKELSLSEAVVMADSPLVGRTVAELRLLDHYDLNLIAVARKGRRLHGRLRDVRFHSGDVLLLQGSTEAMAEQLAALKCLPLADRELRLGKPRKLVLSVLLFCVAVTAILLGWTTAPVALMSAAVAMVLTGVVDLRGAYNGVDWPILVLLAAMIPVGEALEATGGAAAVARNLLIFGDQWPAIVSLAVLLVVTMCLSDIINNAAAAVLMAPIAVNLAEGLGAQPQAFLMAVAIGASCAFLTPIGHQSNTLVLGPGGYRFGDYWRLGLPVQVVIFVVAIPLLVYIWPL